MQKGNGFLPVNIEEMRERGWDQADFVYVCGDAYVDHPSFGAAIITRLLEDAGYRVAFIAQPDWNKEESIAVCGEPRLAFIVSAGNMDSMVNHYTSFKKRRHQDAYTPGGGFLGRPNRATIVYSNLIRKTYKKTPILLGGIEASLRRLAHYDYWSDKVKRSVLLDSGADLLMYGMGEHSILEIAQALDSGLAIQDITYVRGTVFKCRDLEELSGEYELLPSFDEIVRSKEAYAKSYYRQYVNTDAITAKRLVEPYRKKEYIVQNPPSLPLTTEEMDHVYELPYQRTWHPSYDKDGGVPALKEVKFSLTSNRGCFGGCSFCALTFHQGRRVQVRSHESILREARLLIKDPEFKGYIHDVGGPTADFRHTACKKQLKYGVCPDRQCLYPEPCPNLVADHEDYLELLRKLRALPGVKKVFIRSGIRFDYVLADKKNDFLEELCKYHVSGQLKVAPEHICDSVLRLMGKPSNAVYEQFKKDYEKTNRRLNKKQYMVPYLMSSHPGSHLKEAIALAEYIRDLGYMPEQVQDFYPTPGTISTCMFYTGLDPRTMKEVYVPVTLREKQMQRALIQYRNPDNYDMVKEALIEGGRQDLIGFGDKCLIPPRKVGKHGFSGKMPEQSAKSGKERTKTGDIRKKSGDNKIKKKKTIRNIHKKKRRQGA
ncbi:MAG: YgiQ family radical SAM protein [Eubacterium sp.]|nr:YgiQ family radical SAM protein [Eubacterium sp.]MDD7209560.1 YgiQ family radical SAM protein [Lachnospiraceae bacterium]MDY5498444.1 YgiQ family radical SAM protein [Anaerobutyricum sp.]